MATVKVSSELLDKFKSHMEAEGLGSPDSITLSPALVLAVALLYMMAADGEIEEAESSQLQSVVGNNDALLSAALAYVQAVSIETFLDKAPEVLSQQDKQCILVNVFDSLLADGRADEEELALFGQIRSAFGVAEAGFKHAMRVIRLKNDKSVFGPFEVIQDGDVRVSPHLALAVSLLYMMSADGSIGPEEIGQLEAVIGEFEGLQQVALAYVRKVKRDQFFKAVSQSLTAKQKLCILTNVCDSMMSDGAVAVVEDKLFVSMVTAFGLKLKDFDKYHQVLEVKNIRPFDTSKFKSHFKNTLMAGANAQEGEVFEATGAAAELGVEVRRTMHDNIDRVQHDFGSEANILQVNHNATDDLNIQQVAADGSGEPNLQQVSNDALGANVQQVAQDALGVNVQQVNAAADVLGVNLQQVNSDASGANVQQVNSDALGANLQQIQGEQADGKASQWMTAASPALNRQALASDAEFAERQRLGLERQSANVQTLDAGSSALNRQALETGASGSNRAVTDAAALADHLEALPPEERVKNLFQDIEVLSRQLDDFESKNKVMLNAARRAREQEEANQQALINQQLADNAIALAQASSAQALGVPKEHLQSNLQDVGAQVLPTNRQPLEAPPASGAHLAQMAQQPLTDQVTGSAPSQSSQTLGVAKAHVQSNVQELGVEGVEKVNRQRIGMGSQTRDLLLGGEALATAQGSAASGAALAQDLQVEDTGIKAEGAPDSVQSASTSQTPARTAAAMASRPSQPSGGVHDLLARATRARHDIKMYVKLTLTFCVLSFWTSNIAAIYPAKQRVVSGSLVRMADQAPQDLASQAERNRPALPNR